MSCYQNKYLIIIVILLSNLSLFGQIGEVKYYSLSDGLSNNVVNSILQDNHGYLWIGTEDGLNRYDGYSFKNYFHSKKDSTSICSNVITGLLLDENGTLWVATCNGLDTYDMYSDEFVHYYFISNNGSLIKDIDIRAIVKDSAGNIIVYATNASPHTYIFDKKKKVFVSLFPNTKEIDNALNNVRTMYITQSNILWMGSSTDGIFKINRNNNTFINYTYSPLKPGSIKSNEIYHINELPNKEMLIATSVGLYTYDKKNNNFQVLSKKNENLKKIHAWFTFLDSKNNLWIGTEGDGIYLLNSKTKKIRHLTSQNYGEKLLNDDNIRYILEDSLNNIWIGTTHGLIYYINPEYVKFHLLKTNTITKNKIDNTSISAIWKDKDKPDVLWLGTYNFGLINYNTKTHAFKNLLTNKKRYEIISDNINSIRRMTNGDLWIGTHKEGIYVLDKKNRIKQHFLYSPLDSCSLGCNDVRYIFEDSSNKIWIATNGGGLNLYLKDDNKFKRFLPNYDDYAHNLVGEWCLGITEDKHQNLWIYSYNGLSLFNYKKNAFKNFRNNPSNPNSLSSNWVYSVLEDSQGTIWIGTVNGLNLYNQKKDSFKTITTDDGLVNNCIKSMAEDNAGNLWLASNKGLTRIKTKINNNTVKITDIHNFTSDYAIEDNEFIINAVFKDKNKIYFGGSNGLVFFNSDSIRFNYHRPKIIFEDLTINYDKETSKKYRKYLFNNETLKLSYKQLVYSFKFATLDFINSKKNTYEYKLVGFDNKWHNLGYKHDVTFMGLPPGDYKLIVRGANNDGIKTKNEIGVNFTILPPWWKTTWAYSVYVLIIALIVFLIVKEILRRQELEHQIKIDNIEKQKNEELIQAKMSFFTDITHEIRTPLTLIISTIEILIKNVRNKKEKYQLGTIYKNSIRLLNLMNQLLDFRKLELGKVVLNIEKINLISFINEIIRSFEYQSAKKKVNIIINMDIKDKYIWYDKQKFEIILYNVFSNAVKYTNNNGLITVETKETTNKIILTISNSGKGIAPDQLPNIFDRFYNGNTHMDNTSSPSMGIGLALTKRYVSLHKGNIYAESILNKKTSFTIEILKGKKHLNNYSEITNSNNEKRLYVDSNVFFFEEDEFEHRTRNIKKKNTNKPKLLVIEDNIEIQKILKDILNDSFVLFFAENGKQGLKVTHEIMPEIILCDIIMPEIDGLTLCNILKNNIDTSHIPVVLLTAKTTTDDQIAGLKCGADDYIFKPFNPFVLKLKLTNIIKSIHKIHEKIKKEKTYIPSDIASNSLDKEFIQKAIDCVNKNIDNSEFNLLKFSREIGMSERNLQLKLKSLTNQSPVEFIRTIRLNKAAELLKKGELNITQITYETGFNTTSYFTKCFKIQFGITPTEYIRKNTK